MEQKLGRQAPFITTNALAPVGPAEQLFIAGASVFEITVFEPPVQRVTIVGINLPEPGIFGPYNQYLATVESPGEPNSIAEIDLVPTLDRTIWAGSAQLTFGGTLPPMTVSVRPQLFGVRVGPVILQGTVFE